MTDISHGIDNPSGFNPDKNQVLSETEGINRKFRPTAFIKDQETMDYLIKRWKHYAINSERSYLRPSDLFGFGIDYSQEDPREHDWKEQFGTEPRYFNYERRGQVDWRYTLIDQEIPGLFRESATRVHGVNFFEEIQQNLDKRKIEVNTKPLRILVTGSDVGFFNDELRARFNDAIDVAGTTVELSRSSIRKHRFYELIKQGKLRKQIPPDLQKHLTATLKPTIDKRDSKWRSILQMENGDPEFDMIIDTCGELLYSDDTEKPEIFELTFQACIQKLNPGGKLYIAELPYDTRKFVLDSCQKQGLAVEMHNYENRHDDLKTNYVITKPV